MACGEKIPLSVITLYREEVVEVKREDGKTIVTILEKCNCVDCDVAK